MNAKEWKKDKFEWDKEVNIDLNGLGS